MQHYSFSFQQAIFARKGYILRQGREGGKGWKEIYTNGRPESTYLSFFFDTGAEDFSDTGASSMERWRRKKDLEIP